MNAYALRVDDAPDAVPPAFGRPPTVAGLLGGQRLWYEAASLMRDPVWHGKGVPDGGGMPVLLVPGFLAGDPSLRTMRRWLRARDYWTCTSQIRFNVDCTRLSVDRLERRLVEFTDKMGRPTAIIGQSRGGTLAKLVAMRRPDRVSGIFTLGSPNLDPMAINRLLERQVKLVAALGEAGVPGMFREDCIHGDCAEEVRQMLAQPFPPGVRYVAVYSRTDGVVNWKACLDPAAEHVEVRSSHVGMALNPTIYRVLGAHLGELAAEGRRQSIRLV